MFLINFDIFAEALFSGKTGDPANHEYDDSAANHDVDENVVGPVEEDDAALSHVHPHRLALLERRHGEAVPTVIK